MTMPWMATTPAGRCSLCGEVSDELTLLADSFIVLPGTLTGQRACPECLVWAENEYAYLPGVVGVGDIDPEDILDGYFVEAGFSVSEDDEEGELL